MKMKFTAYTAFLYQFVTPVIGAFIVLLNGFELYMFCVTKKKVNMALVYLLNLCLSDITVGAFMIVLKVMDPFMQRAPLKDNQLAKLCYSVMRYCLIRLSLFVSTTNLIALTLDRMYAIARPFLHRRRSKRFAVKVCLFVWLVSVVCASCAYYIANHVMKDTGRYGNLVFPLSTFPATTVFFFCYLKIYTLMRRSPKVGKNVTVKTKREVEFLKLAIKTVALFVLCWLPFSVCGVVLASGQQCGNRNIQFSLFTLAYLNSLLNPFIYLSHVKGAIRRKLARVFCCIGFRSQQNASIQTIATLSTASTEGPRPQMTSETNQCTAR